MSQVPERFLWAAGLMKIKPGDHILEIGCGAGLLAEQIAMRLGPQGKIMAVDRSEPMLAKARQRNQAYIAKGVAEFRTGDFVKAQLPDDHFDSIVAFNVNFFWKEPAAELALIRRALKKKGNLYVFYQAPFEITIEAADPVKRKLLEHGFLIRDAQLQQLDPTAAFCIVAG